jgi:predicted RecA/RadA family phage recombinase
MSQYPSDFVQDDFSIPYEPSSAVTAGDVVVVGSTLVLISKLNIAANQPGNLVGRGIFRVPKVTGAITGWSKLYYDADADPVGGTAGTGAFTTNSALGPFAGWAGPDGAESSDETVLLLLHSSDSPTSVSPTNLGQDDLQKYVVPFTDFRVWDAMATLPVTTAANDDLALINGTFLTSDPTIQGADAKTTTKTNKIGFFVQVPPEYVAGETAVLRISAGMTTTVANGTATVDAEVVRVGAPTVDICATAAQSINSLTAADKDFTLTPTNLVPGDLL